MKPFVYSLLAALLVCGCRHVSPTMTSSNISEASLQQLICQYPTLERGIRQAAALWREEDGSNSDFVAWVGENATPSDEERALLYGRIEHLLEQSRQSADMLMVALQGPTVQTDCSEPIGVDWTLSSYDPMGHFTDDMFANKVAFLTILHFPHFSRAEKDSLSASWTRRDWAYARLGDVFTHRIPATVQQANTRAAGDVENYIAQYNIMMGHVLNENSEHLWPEHMALLSHWNLRDELKSNYALVPHHQEKQEILYQIMLHIIRQDIPSVVINSKEFDWKPSTNELFKNGEKVAVKASSDSRYEQVLKIFHALQQEDACRPDMPTYIERHFEEYMEIPLSDLERMFETLLSSDEVRQTAAIIRERLGRDLRPYDIWYDGFKSRSAFPEDQLTLQTQSLYPNAKAFEKGMPQLLMQMGFTPEKAQAVCAHITVDPARGSGHARPCVGRGEPARLRTRVANTGMDYKGYNIAVHEFGHNVEEVLSLYGMDYYMLAGIPNDGFTEASAFLFQARDLELLGHGKKVQDKNATLDMLWSAYEIMGVGLVDIGMWKWLYAHPKASAVELRGAVIAIAGEVWNRYYEPLLGEKDCPLLGIYSHMIGYALYLPGYSIGQMIECQLLEHLQSCPDKAAWAREYERIYRIGRLTPQAWMQQAVGASLSVEPMLHQAHKALCTE